MSHLHGASSFENIDRQGPSSVQSVTSDTSSHAALETSRHAAQENQNQTYENGGEEKSSKRVLSIFNVLPHGRPNADVLLERRYSFSGLTYGYFSDEEDIDKKGPPSVRSAPLTIHSPHLVLDVGSDAATAGLRPFIFETPPKSRSQYSSTLQEVNQNQAYNGPTESEYLDLYRAALKGNWHDAKDIVSKYPEAIRDTITEARETVLHIACASKHTAFVKEVVRFLNAQDLERTNIDGYTALCFAAKLGIVTIAKEMVKKNDRLPLIRSSEGRTPLHIAALLGRRDMVSYLFAVTSFEHLDHSERMEILVATITNDMYDIALKILKKDLKQAATYYEKIIAALQVLARKGSKSQLSLWRRCCLNSCFVGIGNKALMQALVHELVDRVKEVQLFEERQFLRTVRTLLFDAAKFGNVEILIILIRSHPNIIWTTDDDNRSLFHIAVINRQESVFSLIYEIVAVKEIILTYVDVFDENILHLAGKAAPINRLNIISGAALQMQRELLWFKEIEKIVPPSYLNMENLDGQTPRDIFTSEHQDLQKEGQKWMKATANYCMLVATLITTVVFAAAFTVPGGSSPEKGTPILLESIWFRVFFISDAIALLSSSTSILIFLSILTSRFTEMDFLVSLPAKLVLGLTTLFISIAGMVVAFSATCFLIFKSETRQLPVVIIALTGVPIILFVLLHFKLWADIVHSTCLSMFLFRQRENKLL